MAIANAPRLRVEREIEELQAAFRRAIVDDFANAATAYLALTDAMLRRGVYGGIPRFATAIDHALYQAAVDRRKAER
jgi:hypothetical protein